MYYNYFLFYATIALGYATIQPLVLPVTCLYFTVDSWLWKYGYMYVFVTKNESDGMFWVLLFNRMLFATALGNLATAYVVWIQFSGAAACGILPLIFLLICFKIYCHNTFDDKLEFYTQGADAENTASDQARTDRNDKLFTRYSHPALTKKLMTPLVHEKAKHVLVKVYQISN